jgi:alanine dehydrogenase
VYNGEVRVGIVREGEGEPAGLSPSEVAELCRAGAQTLVETGAGRDRDYREAGAQIVTSAEEVFARCQIVIMAGVPSGNALRLMRPGQVVLGDFDRLSGEETWLACLESGAVCLSGVTIGQREALITQGWKKALQNDPSLQKALYATDGKRVTPETISAIETY